MTILMEDCDVITEIPFVIKILLSFFLSGGQKVNYIYLVSARKLIRVPESQLFLLSDPRVKKKAQQNFMSCW